MEFEDDTTDECVSSTLSNYSLSPKSSKLWNDKGSIKQKDFDEFGFTARCQSANNIELLFGSEPNNIRATVTPTERKLKSKSKIRRNKKNVIRRRIQSDPNEFSLLPLLKKMCADCVWEEDENAKEKSLTKPKTRPKANSYEEHNILITMNDVEPVGWNQNS